MSREERAALWTLVGMFVVFKVVTGVVIYLHDPTPVNIWFQLAMNALPTVAAAVAVGAGVVGSILLWLRLSRLRARRAALIQSEWMVEDGTDWKDGLPHGKIGLR
ncbi:MAG: hypothetical protein U0821_09070 [Chloroflexota bacterium]